ncbi:MAG TPA: acyl-CoA dehydrogenase [Marinobacter sp.]|uniref:DUF6285 domain-containing protein n=1 Tax=marine sediment metagenome TaxID=412755 RepID=A0A0F9V5Y8_9ZZZZ|nr:acyl-CoA dehydrogenase [Marinobacter sp.]
MINNPNIHDLLTEARQVLMNSLTPELTGARKYEALMIANVMGMAIRELGQAEQAGAEAADGAVRAFLEAQSELNHNVECEASLAEAIRERRLDGGDEALREVLRTLTEARLGINSPAYLKR